ncbi:MAG: ATP-binding protein [Sandaracinaceae bacterium]
MKMSRFERRILAAIVTVAAVTLGGALWFGQGAVSEAYRVGVNDRVLEQLRGSLAIYRRHFVALRDDAERTADAVAGAPAARRALSDEDPEQLRAALGDALLRYPNVAEIEVTDAEDEVIARVRDEGRLDPDAQRLLRLDREVDDTTFVVTVATDAEPFRDFQRTGEFVEVYSRLVGGATYVSSFYVGVYIAFLLSVIVIALAVGIIVSRRVTRRVAVLATATERVGAGDLTVEVPSDGEDEIAELTRAFNAMVRDIRSSRDRIEYLQRVGAWQDFARRLAHEIKNPLTPIQLAVQQVHRTYKGDDPKYRRTLEDAASIVDEEIATLRRLVGEFSEFARLPAPALERADLRDVVQNAMRGVDAAALMPEGADEGLSVPTLGLELDDRPLPVMIDAQMFRRALDNLVRNAVQAVALSAPRGGGRVIVASREDRGAALIEVRDDGPGIAPEDRERVFDPYVTTKAFGTGLGLAIVKKVVLEHGGSIGCFEAPEGGAAFRIRLPKADA